MVEVLQPSSFRAGMTIESSESGRAGFVSGGAGNFIPADSKRGGWRRGRGWRR